MRKNTHDPEKWVPVFGKDHAQKRSIAPETCKAVKPMLGFMLEFLVRPIAALA
ncbi:MAG TPA: hypothetical protein VER26_14995 [Xanthobacteraceae bacterium]|nr:hypothetical protein [Xanthobacteraceae bacterium]